MMNYYDIFFEAEALNTRSSNVNITRRLKRKFRGFSSELDADELLSMSAELKNYISGRLYKMGYAQAVVTSVEVKRASAPKSKKKWITNLEKILPNWKE